MALQKRFASKKRRHHLYAVVSSRTLVPSPMASMAVRLVLHVDVESLQLFSQELPQAIQGEHGIPQG